MMVAALLAVSLFGHGRETRVATHTYHVHDWRVVVRHDQFADRVTCSINTRRITYLRETLVFHIGGGDTTHAYFRLDGALPRSVREAFTEDEAHGFFPERGWIVDPNGGDVALPAAYVTGVNRVYIRATLKSRPRTFDVSRLFDALARARAAGCTEKTIN
jgi:hypothetical protein